MRYLPVAQMQLEIPQRPADMASPRIWNKLCKSAARGAIVLFHQQHIAERFEPGATAKYGYFQRTPKYLKRKLADKGHGIDLVYGGGSRREMRQHYQVRSGGTGEAGTLNVSLVMRFPFKGGTGRSRNGAGSNPVGRMITDMQKFTDMERAEIVLKFNVLLMEYYERWQARRKRIRTRK